MTTNHDAIIIGAGAIQAVETIVDRTLVRTSKLARAAFTKRLAAAASALKFDS